MKEKMKKNQDFEKSKHNEKEKELYQKMKLLSEDFEKEQNTTTLKEIENIQEQLIEISLNEINKNNLDKQYKQVKRLFKLYDFEFTNYYSQYKNLMNEYLQKIKKYMTLFKSSDAFYLKSLVKIFKDDKCENRISHIVYICINLYLESLKNGKNRKFSAFYYNESLELINFFKEKIKIQN